MWIAWNNKPYSSSKTKKEQNLSPKCEKTSLQGFGINKGADQSAQMQSDQHVCYSLFVKYYV